MTKLLLTHELAHLLLSYTTMVSPSMDAKSRISKASGFHWWCIITQYKRAVINEGAGPIQRGGLTTFLHQIVDFPLVLLSIAAIRSLCRGLSSNNMAYIITAFVQFWLPRIYLVGSCFLARERERDREMIFQSQIPMLSLLLYDFDIPFFNKMCFTYFVHTFRSTALRSEKRHHLMINGSIVLLWL
jgi:hypothetical protein